MNDDLATGSAADTPAAPSVVPSGAGQRGCPFALSQPPMMLFLAVIGTLLLFTALYDLLAG